MPDSQIAALEQRRAHLLGQIAATGEMRAGSLTARYRRCGTAGCHCAQPGDPGHGPVLSLTRQQGGKTITRIIPSHAEAETRARIAEHRRFRQLSKQRRDELDAGRISAIVAALAHRPNLRRGPQMHRLSHPQP